MSKMFYHVRRVLVPAILLALLVVPQCLLAQGSGTVKGRVIDRKTGDALPGANIVVPNSSLGAATNLDGRFEIRNVPAGRQTFKASYIGYVSQSTVQNVQADAVTEFEIGLNAQAVTGEEVVVTAQAMGQNAAINQQLSSNTIANIVSSARIKELPDVNAAESIGRLPGVAINRWNGEATTVVIRGLSAKYNTITVNGVALPATGGDDRSVDLSMISSNILDGIEVKKANTPDMEAAALGGTVDLKLREASVEPALNLSAQMGYSKLQDYYGNYAFTANWSRRFFDNALGVIASLNADRYNRAADKFSGSYQVQYIGTLVNTGIQTVELRDEAVMRKRGGGSILLDYAIPLGKVTANGFFNRLNSDNSFRVNRPDREHGSHYYEFDQNKSKTDLFTAALGLKQDFELFSYDLNIARTGAYTDDPDNRQWSFSQENNAFPNAPFDTPPFNLPALETVDSNKTGFQAAYINSTKRWEYQNSMQLNFKIPFNILGEVNGYFKFGGSYRWLDRTNNETQWGRDGLQYGQTSVNAPLTAALTTAAQLYPNDFNWQADSTLARMYGQLPITRFLDRNYNRKDFLGSTWPQGMVANFDLLNKFTNALSMSPTEWKEYASGSLQRDYSGVERYQAAYLMTQLDYGQFISVIPGVRWERYYTAYHGQVFRDNKVSNVEQPPADYARLYVERDNQFVLPMVHVILTPLDWLKVRLAKTETLTQPDYMMYAPITSMNSYNSYSRAANSQLKPAHSYNYDVSFSVFDNDIGLFSLSGFYKDVYDLILQSTINYTAPQGSDDPGYPLPAGLNLPSNWLGSSFQIDTYTNSPARAIYKGFEVEWQTHFWYLPSVLQGLVLNANYTRIYSQTNKQLFKVVTTDEKIGSHRPPIYKKVLVEYSRPSRMPDQPAHTLNLSVGYDYEGFSTRLIFLYQSDRTRFIAKDEELDTYTAAYYRWDLTFQQKLGWGLQLYANLNNLNNRHDETYLGYSMSDPSYLEYYGFTMDIGVRFSL
jgi:TonB-dependent receptor